MNQFDLLLELQTSLFQPLIKNQIRLMSKVENMSIDESREKFIDDLLMALNGSEKLKEHDPAFVEKLKESLLRQVRGTGSE